MSKLHKYFLVILALMVAITALSMYMGERDLNVVPGQTPGATVMLDIFNYGQPQCTVATDNSVAANCSVVTNRETLFGLVLVALDIILFVGGLMYWLRQWQKRIKHHHLL